MEDLNALREKHRAPQINSTRYWLYIIIFGFCVPFIMTSVICIMLVGDISPILSLLVLPLSAFISFHICKRTHHKMQNMSEREYIVCFNTNIPEPIIPKDSQNPMDPSSALYWTPIGNGYKMSEDRTPDNPLL